MSAASECLRLCIAACCLGATTAFSLRRNATPPIAGPQPNVQVHGLSAATSATLGSDTAAIAYGKQSSRARAATTSRRKYFNMSLQEMGGKPVERTEHVDKKHRILGLGSAGLDFIALVDRYPPADAKVRTESLEIVGGGNCGNTIVAASRLGLDACLATKVGADVNGRLILDGLKEEGVDVTRVIVSDKTPSAFTYVIVDQERDTRTCIHTPQTEEILPEEITADLLEGVSAVHLDSRHTLAAVSLARLANQMGVPVVVDAEKDRPHFQELLPLADYVVCNRNFPEVFTGRPSREEALRCLLSQGRAKLVASTLGAEGCIVMTRREEPPWSGFDDISIPSRCPVKVTSTRFHGGSADDRGLDALDGGECMVVEATSWPMSESDVVDTTGAGDSFIAAFIYGVTHKMGIGRTLALSSLVAARKLSQPGARRGVPTLGQIKHDWPELLAS